VRPKLAATIYRANSPALFFILILLAWFEASTAFGQVPPPIIRITITNVGPQAASEALVRANLRVKEGDRYSTAAINSGVQQLYKTGYFLNVRVTEDFTADGVHLRYILLGRPKVTEIVFRGNKKFSTRKLTKKLTIKVGDPLEEHKLFTDAEEIKKMYQKSGYPQTEVTYIMSPPEQTGRTVVTFEIKESPKVRIEDVHFEGAQAFSQKKLRKVIKTRRHWMFSWLTGSGVLKKDVMDEDEERLAEFYRNEGYIDFNLKEVKYLYDNPRKLIVYFDIHEGRQYRVGAVDFKGMTLFTTNQALSRLKMNVGSIFTPKGFNQNITAMEDLYGAKGYIDVEYGRGLRVIRKPNTQTGTIDLTYEIEEGNKSYIEKIEIRGNTKTKDRVIRRELAVSPGEVFDMTRVKLSRLRLEGLNYFERVEAEPEPDATLPADRKNLVISVAEKNTGNFSVGAGYSSIDNLFAFVEVSQGNFDLFNPPKFMGGGQKLRLRAQVGGRLQDYQITFIEPWFLGRKLEFSTDLYHRELSYVSINRLYDERRTGARLGVIRALGSDFLKGGVSYTIENVGIIDVDTNAPVVIQQEEGDRLVSKAGLSLIYDTRNNALNPSTGTRTELRGELAGGPFGGETDFYKVELGSVWFFPGFFKGHVFEVRGRTGFVESYGDSSRVPLFDRFFLGGITSLRGYRYREVGPQEKTFDGEDEPVGGNTYWFGSAEYRIPIIERLKLALFYDIGMVQRDAFNWRLSDYNDNWGVGVLLDLPIGPLRLDYGIPIRADRHNDSSGRFQFSAGYHHEF
jgi:outer membrane protein insertion porin family